MEIDNKDYELVARWMDGEKIDLTDEQRSLAAGISAEAEVVAQALDVSMPAGILHRVGAAVRQGLQTTRKRRRNRSDWAGVAVAAAVIMAAVLILPSGPAGKDAKKVESASLVDVGQFLYDNVTDELDLRVETLGEDLANAQADVVLDEDFSSALAIASFEQEIGELMIDTGGGQDSWADQQSLWNSLQR